MVGYIHRVNCITHFERIPGKDRCGWLLADGSGFCIIGSEANGGPKGTAESLGRAAAVS